jgi:hypothetical protein
MRIKFDKFGACLERIATKGAMGPETAKALLAEVADRAERMRRTGDPDPFVTAAKQLAERLKETARKDKLDALRNSLKREAILEKIDSPADAAQVLHDAIRGSNIGSRENAQSQWLGMASQWLSALEVRLKKSNLLQAAISGGLDSEVADEMRLISAGRKSARAESDPARQISEAYAPLLAEVHSRLNAAGARIGNAFDFVLHTWHDPYWLRRGGRNAAGGPPGSAQDAFLGWWKVVEPKLAERTFDGIVQKEGESIAGARMRFGKSVFDALVAGIHMTPDGAFGLLGDESGNIAGTFEGTRNLAKRLSQPRVLLWKSGGDWLDYMQQYGRYRSLHDGMLRSIDQSAKNIALMERFGTNPGLALNTMIDRVREKFRDDPDAVRKFNTNVDSIKNEMARLDGSANIPVNELWHSLGSQIRAAYNMTSLGGVGVTHFASVWATAPTELRHHGISPLEGIGKIVGALLKGKGAIERQEILSDMGAFAGGSVFNFARNWAIITSPGETIPGRVAALQNIFMRATGIHYIFDVTRAAVKEMASHNLARNLTTAFEQLEPHLNQMLQKYGIGPEEWKLLQGRAGELKEWEGRKYFTPTDALNLDRQQVLDLLQARKQLPPETLAPAQPSLLEPGAEAARLAGRTAELDRAVGNFRQGVADKLLMYFHDIGDHSVVVPGVRERAMYYGGDRPGSMNYEAKHLLLQFKIWPLAAINQVFGREYYMSLSKTDFAKGMGLVIGLSTLAGYSRMVINDLATGHPVRDPRDWKTLLAGLAQGGGLGLFGDFLFGETSRMGTGFWAAAAGPLGSDIDTLFRIYNRFREDLHTEHVAKGGRFSNLWADLAHFGVRHVPFANLVYLKGALDYLLWYHLFEAASPGWWQRTNRRLEKEQGRTMTGYQPGAGVPWTPWGLGQGR